MCCTTTAVYADDYESGAEVTYHLQVIHADGSEVKVPFADKPEIIHTGSSLKLTSSELEMEYPEGTLSYFTIVTQSGPNGINETTIIPGKEKTLITDSSITYTGGSPGATVTIAHINGTIVAQGTLDSDGAAIIPFAPEKGGIYVINSGKTTFKIIKK